MQFQMQEQRQDGVVILAPEGRLDSGKINHFEKIVQERIRGGHRHLLINCENLVFLASSALRVLLQTLRKLNEVEGKMALCNMNPHVHSIFENSGFTKLMDIRESLNEGLAQVRPPGARTDKDAEPKSEDEPGPTPSDVQTHHDAAASEHAPTQKRESMIKRTVLGPFRFIRTVGRFLFP